MLFVVIFYLNLLTLCFFFVVRIRLPPISTRTDTRCPYTTLFLSMTLTGHPRVGSANTGNTRDGISSRHERILSLLESRGFVSIGSLAKSFAVSEQTVRRDLNDLERRGLVTRYHGGAGLPPVAGDVDYDKRKRRDRKRTRLNSSH